MKTAELGDILKYDNKLVEVVGIAEGKTIIMKPLNTSSCDKCGHEQEIHVLENCVCLLLQKISRSGCLVTTQKGLVGRTYHNKGLINDKVPVYVGENTTPMLCRPETLTLTGFID